jgi:very-short-patch-repair endonuclease
MQIYDILMQTKIRSPKYVIDLARKMRVNPTPTEKLLWNELKEKKLDGYRFRNQHPIYRYIIDFYCVKKLLAIEIDGEIHKQRLDYDEYRDAYLNSIGIETLRFNNQEVIDNINLVLDKIKQKLQSK